MITFFRFAGILIKFYNKSVINGVLIEWMTLRLNLPSYASSVAMVVHTSIAKIAI